MNTRFQRGIRRGDYEAVSCRPAGVKPTETIAFAFAAWWRSARSVGKMLFCITSVSTFRKVHAHEMALTV